MSAPADSRVHGNPEDYGLLTVRGPDSGSFLQGQLSAQMDLAEGASTLAGFHNPQGRVIAVLSVTRRSVEEFLVALPRDLVVPVSQRLRKFVLRAKVRIEEVAASPEIPGGPDLWTLAGLRAGLPMVYAATTESFVAQMLNLDLIGAIAFDKGCYTGQEVIARAHYRGRVKRRMQRWLNMGDVLLKPGDTAHARDGRSLSVVRVASDGDGRQELLAVGTFGPGDAAGPEPAAAGSIIVDGPLPLPYSLPD
jgi:folate-binding protein YgfZ